MSLVIATHIPGIDTYVTSDSMLSSNFNPDIIYSPARQTSTFSEDLSGVVTVGGKPVFVREHCCKIGILGQGTICGFVGSVDFALVLLEAASFALENILSFESVIKALHQVADSISPCSFPSGTCTEIVFARNLQSDCPIFGGLYIVGSNGRVTVIPRGVDLSKLPTQQAPFQIAIGSGKELVEKYFPDGLLQGISNSSIPMAVVSALLAYDYGECVRRHGRAGIELGVGGTYMGLHLNHGSPRYTLDTIAVSSNEQNKVLFLNRIVYRNGYFVATDFIRRHIIITRTLEREIEVRTNKLKEDWTVLEQVGWELSAQLVIQDCKSCSIPEQRGIFYNDGECVLNMNVPLKSTNDLPEFTAGTVIKIGDRELVF